MNLEINFEEIDVANCLEIKKMILQYLFEAYQYYEMTP